MTSLLQEGRTHTCNELRIENHNQRAVLFGWVNTRRDHGGRIFIDLRDRDGLTQVVFGPDVDAAAHEAASSLRSEDCIGVAGKVIERVDNDGKPNANTNLATGQIELEADTLEVFSKAQTPPFDISKDDRLETNEILRLQYRYLDLRRPSLQRNFIMRSKLATLTRAHMTELGFLELETPYMVKYTPGGARNFLVPSRLNPGMFYALAESPQIFKQLFMVAGFDKYFQITRCFRDEDLRNDRQPEFTQIDVEMSFATPERVFEAIESLIVKLWGQLLGVEIPRPFLRLTWEEAMARFGSDKPDMRFGLEFSDLTELVRGCGFAVFEGAEYVKGICIPPEHGPGYGRAKIDKLTEFAKKRESGGAKGLAWARVEAGGVWQGGSAKFIAPELQTKISAKMGAEPGALLLFVADDFETTHAVLNAIRLRLRDELELLGPNDQQWKFLWVTDFPMFERSQDGRWGAAHHPFTSPRDEHVDLLVSDPGKVRARAYDLVLNGNEIGGGSIRIHRSDVQAKVFEALGMSDEEKQAKFGFLLDAFKYGPPPHGGIALGVDRLSMLLAGAQSLRDVIAFPKTQKGQDLMTSCPTPADDAQLAELFIRHRPLPGQTDEG
jgi:aspartyl-tRNA synthetase